MAGIRQSPKAPQRLKSSYFEVFTDEYFDEVSQLDFSHVTKSANFTFLKEFDLVLSCHSINFGCRVLSSCIYEKKIET